MKEKLIEIKRILDTKVLNGYQIKKNKQMKLYICTGCERKVRNAPYFYKSVKKFLQGGGYSDLVINDLGNEIYIDKVD